MRSRSAGALRSILALGAGFVAVQIVLYGLILLLMPDLLRRPGGFPVGSGLALLLAIEILAGAAGPFVAVMLAGRAPALHGWVLGAIIFAFNLWVVTEPGSPWPTVPAVIVVAAVPLQTWAAVTLALRVRGRNAAERGPREEAP